MGAISAHHHLNLTWTNEDDFRLRKAAEAGTSFESLARGDVKFSKRFTMQQLQERWLSILYDPVVSAESSARMLELEHDDSAPVLKAGLLGNIEESGVPGWAKRKPESVRKRFYAMQKKIRRGHLPAIPPAADAEFCSPVQNDDDPIGLLTYEPAHNAENTNGDASQYFNGDDNNCNDEESDGFDEILELLDAKGPDLLPPIIDESMIQSIPNVNPGDAEMENQMYAGDTTNAVANSTNNYLINDLFDLTMEDNDLPLMDADGNLIDMSYIDDLSSRWLDSPKNNSKHDTVLVDEFLDNKNEFQPEYGNQEANPLDSLLISLFKTPLTSTIICTLNTEDPDIPSNDDVFLLNLVPSTSREMQMDAFKPPRPSQLTSKSINRITGADLKRDFRVSNQIIPKNSQYAAQTQFSSPIIGSQFRSEIQGDHSIKREICHKDQSQGCSAIVSRSNFYPAYEKTTIKTEQEMHCFSSAKTVSDDNNNKLGGSIFFENHAQLTPMATFQQEALNVEIVSTDVNNPILVPRNLPLYEEAISSDDDGDYDIPNFSDVEAMILDEDTSLDEQHVYMNRIGSSELLQTFKYENVETQRKIMRLEQAAAAFVKREMKSHGAFAILQGRHMKYYVTKPEVLIGRATEECNVDIDLGRECQNSKVSRRQAIIHMDHEGSFHIKNLSKYPIFINNMELATNQSVGLSSSCLIEIKGMAFLFETCNARIKQYVNSLKNKTDMADN